MVARAWGPSLREDPAARYRRILIEEAVEDDYEDVDTVSESDSEMEVKITPQNGSATDSDKI